MTIVLRTIANDVEFYTVAATGESGLSQTGLSLLAGVTRQAILKLQKSLFLDFEKPIILKTRNAIIDNVFVGNLVIYSLDFAKKVLSYCYTKGLCSPKGASLIGLLPYKGKAKVKLSPEQQCRTQLQELEGGIIEVITSAGRIDLLTNTELIEIKEVKGWKGGLGQLLVYSVYYPNHTKRLHLFGSCVLAYLDLVEQHCKPYSIRLTHQA